MSLRTSLQVGGWVNKHTETEKPKRQPSQSSIDESRDERGLGGLRNLGLGASSLLPLSRLLRDSFGMGGQSQRRTTTDGTLLPLIRTCEEEETLFGDGGFRDLHLVWDNREEDIRTTSTA
uniref:Uncharacterized protein n=1 Tax=Panagrellus redivivus TaxID=6233 RepID=A0A7E4VLJ2_PANRE